MAWTIHWPWSSAVEGRTGSPLSHHSWPAHPPQNPGALLSVSPGSSLSCISTTPLEASQGLKPRHFYTSWTLAGGALDWISIGRRRPTFFQIELPPGISPCCSWHARLALLIQRNAWTSLSSGEPSQLMFVFWRKLSSTWSFLSLPLPSPGSTKVHIPQDLLPGKPSSWLNGKAKHSCLLVPLNPAQAALVLSHCAGLFLLA